MDKHLAIVNAAAGSGQCGKLAGNAISDLRDKGLELDVWYTRRPGHAVELARDALGQGYRSFIAVGGDGTAHEIVNGVAEVFSSPDERVCLGFLPLGTGNSFIRDYTRLGEAGAMAGLLRGRTRPCDVVRVRHAEGELYFINIFSFGFVADVCELTNARYKALGSAGYAMGVMAMLARLRFEPVFMRLDGEKPWEQRAAFVSINNSQYTGGNMQMAPYANPADGLVDLVVVGELGRAKFVSLFLKIFRGGHVHHPEVTTSRAATVEFNFDAPLPVMVDGEVVHIAPRELDVLPGALDVRI
ncbi:MAG: diacylglycerol kinase family lipid kinase [Myxococcales bacterium]|nr:diacylglycerol kinase family lipid kinase [Myxococcales bacterium]